MSTIARLYDFIAGAPSSADAVDAEFNQIISFLTGSVVHKDGTVAMTGALTLPANPTTNLQAATKQYVDAMVTAPALPGVIAMFGGTVPPAGWFACEGAAVSRTTYAALFAAIGTTHGAGDGSTTFNLPDLRGRAPIGMGLGPGLTNRTAGVKLGGEQPQSHSHILDRMIGTPVSAHTHGYAYSTWIAEAPQTGAVVGANSWTAASGSGVSGNMQPSTVVLFIIKA